MSSTRSRLPGISSPPSARATSPRWSMSRTSGPARSSRETDRGCSPQSTASTAPRTRASPSTRRATQSGDFFDSFNLTDFENYFSVVRTLRGVFDSLAPLPGRRKAVAFIGVGIPLDDGFGKPVTGGPAVEVMELLNQAFRAAQRANVNVYPLDPGGLRAPYNMGQGSQDPGNPGFYNREFLKTVAENTGGIAVVDTNDAHARNPAGAARERLLLPARLRAGEHARGGTLSQDRSSRGDAGRHGAHPEWLLRVQPSHAEVGGSAGAAGLGPRARGHSSEDRPDDAPGDAAAGDAREEEGHARHCGRAHSTVAAPGHRGRPGDRPSHRGVQPRRRAARGAEADDSGDAQAPRRRDAGRLRTALEPRTRPRPLPHPRSRREPHRRRPAQARRPGRRPVRSRRGPVAAKRQRLHRRRHPRLSRRAAVALRTGVDDAASARVGSRRRRSRSSCPRRRRRSASSTETSR